MLVIRFPRASACPDESSAFAVWYNGGIISIFNLERGAFQIEEEEEGQQRDWEI